MRLDHDELGPLTPLHFSRFYPLYKMQNHFPTPVSTLERARELALKAGLKYVYLGNIPGNPAESTHCHGCGKLLIERTGYRIGRCTEGRRLRLLRGEDSGDLAEKGLGRKL